MKTRLKIYDMVAFTVLYLAFATHSAGVSILDLSKLTAVTDSTYFQGRKVSPDSVARKVSFGLLRDTTRAIARTAIHDSLAVRVPQAIDTAASPHFVKLKLDYTTTGSTTAVLGTLNCPAHTGTAPNSWIGFIAANGDTLWVPGWK